jgi:hypothetical protein
MLHTEYRVENEPTEFTNVVFKGVQGYHFENDAFGNVISGLEPIPLEQFLTENGAEIPESWHGSGVSTGARRARAYSLFVIRFVRLGSRKRAFHFLGPTGGPADHP